MTDAEKMAANRVVAEAMGWRVEIGTYESLGIEHEAFTLYRPSGFSHCHNSATEEGAWSSAPQIFANTEAGAWAREQAAGWLLAQGIGDMGVWHSSSLAFYFDEPTWFVKIGPAPRCSGKTIGEATATAIHAAVVALGAGGEG